MNLDLDLTFFGELLTIFLTPKGIACPEEIEIIKGDLGMLGFPFVLSEEEMVNAFLMEEFQKERDLYKDSSIEGISYQEISNG